MASKIFTYICITFVIMAGFLSDISIQDGTITVQGISNGYAACGDPGFVGPCPQPATYDKEKEMLDSLVSGINVALSILTIIVTPAIILASWLMSPDWTSGDLFNMRPVIHDMWILISNVTYFIYAILLIVIALGTIFNSENYGYKQLLPRLALGIILVPLTWWFIQFTISLASIVTASVMNIPADIVITQNKAEPEDKNWWTKKSIPKEIIYENKKDATKEETKKDCTKVECISPKDFLTPTGGGGIYGSLVVYAFAVFKIQDIKEIKNTSDLLATPFQLVHQLIVGALMFIVFGLLVMALIVLLFMRAVKLWFYAMFSPLMTLKFVLGDKIFGKDSESFDLKEFIGLAFVPAIVGLALSFGLVVVSMLMHAKNDGNRSCTGTTCTITLFGNTQSQIKTGIETNANGQKETITTVTLGGLTYKFKGAVSGTNTDGLTLNGALDKTGGIVGTIIVDIIALIFIWIAFMAAKGVSKVASAAFEPFEQLGSKIAKLPKYAPIPFTGGMSMEGMKSITNEVINKHESESINRAKNSVLGKAMGIDKTASGESTVNTGKAIDAINANNTTDSLNYIKKAKESLQKDISEGKDVKPEIARLAESLRTLKKTNTIMYDKIVSDSGMDGKILKDIISDREKSITKNDFKIDELQKAILGSSTGGAGTGGNSSSSGFNAKTSVDNANEIVVNIDGVNVTMNKNAEGISQAELDELAKKSGTWTQKEFTDNLKSGGITNDANIEKIIKAVQNLKNGDKDFFKKS